MQIDWFTFAAQIVNFLILVALLKRFLYGPIIEAMDRREEKIASRLDEAKQKRQEAEEEAAAYREQREQLDEQRKDLLAQAKAEAEQRRRELLEEARREVDRMETRWHEALRREQTSFLHDLSQRAEGQIVATVRRTLRDLADAELEEQIVDMFLSRLRELDGGERDAFVEALQCAGHPPVVCTRFELSATQRERITEVVQEQVDEDVTFHFETAPEVGVGIEMRAGGHKIAWSLSSYLGALEERISEALEEALRARLGEEHASAVTEKEQREDQKATIERAAS